MNQRERVLTALRGGKPDRVPYCEFHIDRILAARVAGWPQSEGQLEDLESNPFSATEAKSIASALHLDNVFYVLRAPIFAELITGKDGRHFYGDGTIKSWDDLSKLVLPDPTDPAFYKDAQRFVDQKGDYAAAVISRVGISPTMLSMGLETFSLALYDDPALVETVLDRYCDWAATVARRVCAMGFDFFVSTDDMAHKSGPVFSPQVFHDLVLPRYQRVAEQISLPWVVHSDGNIEPLLPDLVTLPVSAIHPVERAAMDIRKLKRKYGKRLCLMGNVDLNTLSEGTPRDVEEEARALIQDVGAGGGYILSSGNSLPEYVKPENALAMGSTVVRYG
jgi:uroporphyrinogen decarboxylase